MPSEQAPIQSGFGAASTAEETLGGVDLSGKTVIVTGGCSGIGLETTLALTRAGASVIAPARSPDKAREALASIPNVEQGRLDLLAPDTIDAFADAFLASGRPLDLLINNAGVMAMPSGRDARGYEQQFAANHLGHFQLTARLWPALRRAASARVVTLSSGAHRLAGVDFDDPNFERREYDPWKAYGQSKTANILFTVTLDQKGEGCGVRAFAVHPGRILTDLQRFMSLRDLQARGFRDENGEIPAAQRHLYKTPQQGAATTIWCAANPALDGLGGVYCEDCDVAQAVPADHRPLDGVMPWAIDRDAAARLWTLSERMTGAAF